MRISRFAFPVMLAATAAAGVAACAAKEPAPVASPAVGAKPAAKDTVLSGKEAFGDYSSDAPGIVRHITVADLPQPYETKSVDTGPRSMAPRPSPNPLKTVPGFRVEEVVTGLGNPRKIITAPNGDMFVAESGPGRVKVLRPNPATGKPDIVSVFATGLDQPFGLAFFPTGKNPKWLYVGNTGSVVRLPYKNGDTVASGPSEMIADDVPSGGRLRGGGHWTRDVAFAPNNKRMYVSVGSSSNVMQNPNEVPKEVHRADILVYDLDRDGHQTKEDIYASGIRNAVGIAIQPGTNTLWMSVNERDGLGDNLVPDYISTVKEGGFYGWPWFYMGNHPDVRAQGKSPVAGEKVIVPDVLLQPHYASLALTFYTGDTFPKEYRGQIFAAEHGSWNRSRRTGYKIIRAILDKKGHATGEFEDFVTGFITGDGDVWGRPVGVTVGNDGDLYFTDDGTNTVWRVVYEGTKTASAKR